MVISAGLGRTGTSSLKVSAGPRRGERARRRPPHCLGWLQQGTGDAACTLAGAVPTPCGRPCAAAPARAYAARQDPRGGLRAGGSARRALGARAPPRTCGARHSGAADGARRAQVALDDLGLDPCFHARFFPYLPDLFDVMFEYACGRRTDLAKFPAGELFAGFRAAVDIPPPLIMPVLEAFPHAKVRAARAAAPRADRACGRPACMRRRHLGLGAGSLKWTGDRSASRSARSCAAAEWPT